jgi:anaerobic ribonucleoside-triphosphate reductase activating protein
MNYGMIKPIDSVNGVGVRVSLFVSGCRHRCPGCFNSQAADFSYGKPFGQEQIDQIIKYLDHPYIKGLTILGGDPIEPENHEMVYKTILAVRDEFGKTKTIWVYTGGVYENIIKPDSRYQTPVLSDLLGSIDVLVDGPFVIEKKDISLKFRGSSNQRIIDMPETISQGKVIELKV